MCYVIAGARHVMSCERHVPAGVGVGSAACGPGGRQPRAVCLEPGVAHGRQQAPQCRTAGHALPAGLAPGAVIPACEPTPRLFAIQALHRRWLDAPHTSRRWEVRDNQGPS